MNEHSPVLTTSLRADMDPATRRAYVQKWIARNQRRVSAGLGATVLTLPLLAQAQSAEGLVNVLDIAGVRSVALNADGSAQLTLGNGQQVQVAASSVQLAADGSVMISAAAAELVAEVVAGTAASGAAGAGAGGGIGGAGIAAAVGGLGLAAAAAGGGGGSSSGDSAPAIPVLNASAITPTSLQNVTAVFGSLPELGPQDSLFLKIGDGDEVKVTIGEDGSLIFPSAIDLALFQGQQTLSYRVEQSSTVEGEDDEGNPTSDTVTEDVASGSAVVFIDTIAPVITITTPIAGDDVINAAEKGEGIVIEGTAEGAENGQIVTLTLNGTEFTATVTDEAWSLPITAAELTALGLVSGDPVEITANVADAAGNPAEQDEATVGTDFIAEIRIDQVVIETLNTFIGVTVRGDTKGVEADQPITVTFNGQNIPGVVVQADGSWSANVPASVIKALDDGADITISASVSDLADNSDTSATIVTTDFSTPPLAITSPEADGFINQAAADLPLVVSGIALPDQPVTVTLTGGATRTIEASDTGSWTTSFEPSDLPADGEVAINATITIEGETANAPTVILTKDTVPPEVTITDLGLTDGILNIPEQASGFTISGTISDPGATLAGVTLTVTLNGGAPLPVVLNADGTWTSPVPASVLSALATGTTVTVVATATDAALNTSAPAEVSFVTDFTLPEISITDLGGIAANGQITAADLLDEDGADLGTLLLRGTSNAPESNTVTLTIGTALRTAQVQEGGSWSVEVSTATIAEELGGLESITLSASVQNAVGNTGTGTLPLGVDLRVPSIILDAPADGFVIGLTEFAEGFTISGTTENVPDDQLVTIIIQTGPDNEDRFEATTPVTNGEWSLFVSAQQVKDAPDESSFTLTASVSDGSFPVPATTEIGISTNFPPEITMNPLGEDGALILADIADEITFSGTTRGVQAGQEVTLFFDEGNGPESLDEIGPILVQNDGSWSLTIPNPDLEGIDPGMEITFTARVSNASGRPAPEASETVVAYQPSLGYVSLGGNAPTGELLFNLFVDPERIEGDILRIVTVGIDFDPDILQPVISEFKAPVFFDSSALALNFFNITAFDGIGTAGDTGRFSFNGLSAAGLDNIATKEVLTMAFEQSGDSVIVIGLGRIGEENLVISTDRSEFDGTGETYSELFAPVLHYFGSGGVDTIVAANVDTVIRGRGGDDQIDVSAPGVNTIIFEGGSVANGFDTITGFTLGGALADRFAIAFDTFDQDVLRGDGSAFQVTSGGAVGADVGLVVFTTAVADFDNATIEAALGDLTGLNDGDNLYVLIGDGTNAVLTAFEIDGSALMVRTGSGTSYAEFKDIGDLSGFSSANILGFEQHMV